MTIRIGAFLMSILFSVSACGVAAFARAHAGAGAGAVYVTTLPDGADIWIDGTYVGRAPVLVDALVPGHHALTLTRTGWQAQEVDVMVPAGGVAMSSTRLLPGPRTSVGTRTGTIVLRDAPVGAAVAVDGVAFTAPPGQPVPLAAGPHRVAMTTSKGRVTRTFTVLPDMTTDLVLREEPAATLEAHAGVLAQVDDYVGADAYTIAGTRIVVRVSGHTVVARFGDSSVRYDGATLSYDAAPTSIGGKLYFPLALLEKLSNDMSKTP